MKKFRIIFALVLLVSCFALPAHADFFYLRQGDTDTTVKVAPFTLPDLAFYDYPKDLVLNSTSDAPAFVGTYTLNSKEYMIASNWDATNNCQSAYIYQYKDAAWGETTPTAVPIPDSGQNPSDVVCSGNYIFLTDRGAQGASGSLTVHDTQDSFARVGSIVFNNTQEKLTTELLPSGCVAHADSIFVYNSTIYVLLSVEQADRTYTNSILAVVAKGDDDNYTVTQAVKLNTKANAYGENVPYIDSTGYILLAQGSTIEKVTLGSTPSSTALVSQGIDLDGWTGYFSTIARDSNDNTYIMCKSDETQNATILVYKVSSTKLDALKDDQLTSALTGNPIYNDSDNHQGKPFVMSDSVDSSVVFIYLGEPNAIDYWQGGSKKDAYSGANVLGGNGYITEYPVLAAAMANPSSTQISDSSGGCNAGATAAMLIFCAIPLIFKKKH